MSQLHLTRSIQINVTKRRFVFVLLDDERRFVFVLWDDSFTLPVLLIQPRFIDELYQTLYRIQNNGKHKWSLIKSTNHYDEFVGVSNNEFPSGTVAGHLERSVPHQSSWVGLKPTGSGLRFCLQWCHVFTRCNMLLSILGHVTKLSFWCGHAEQQNLWARFMGDSVNMYGRLI